MSMDSERSLRATAAERLDRARVACLRLGVDVLRMGRFVLVGASGVGINSLLLYLAADVFGIHYLPSAVLATQGSTLWNFAWTELWVFGDRRHGQAGMQRLAQFLLLNNAALTLRGPLIFGLTSGLGVHYLLSNLISIGLLTVLRYGLANVWIWRAGRSDDSRRDSQPAFPTSDKCWRPIIARRRAMKTYKYNIHDIITLESEARLPELEQFQTQQLVASPSIRVRLGGFNSTQPKNGRPSAPGCTRLQYSENLGLLGFAAQIELGNPIELVAAPILQWSPHVLYTNLVEPVLRWAFVEQGYALVHGACIAFGKSAYLITAKTDTGKTTTVLQLLNRQRRKSDQAIFLSDDLTLLAPDGSVLAYPKPLTISLHTVRALNATCLSLRERLGLILQSRVHSRSSRRLALLLARTRLPMATVNTVIQWLVPPPKYQVQRLVPSVKLGCRSRLAGIFVIERGNQEVAHLSDDEAVEILLRNSADAFGFPPYQAIEAFLTASFRGDLRPVERETVAQALAGRPASLLRSNSHDWWRRIPSLVAEGLALPVPDQPPSALKAGVSLL